MAVGTLHLYAFGGAGYYLHALAAENFFLPVGLFLFFIIAAGLFVNLAQGRAGGLPAAPGPVV
jgi:hypothetical protein